MTDQPMPDTHNIEECITLEDDFSIRVKAREELAALAWLEGRKGIPYARLQCLGVIFPELRHVPLIRNGFKRAFCSESGADFLFFWGLQAKFDARLFDRDWIDPYALKLIAPSYGSEVTA